MKMWVYKNTTTGTENPRASGDFNLLFHDGHVGEWGGKWAFGARSARYLDGDMSEGDGVLCYQTNQRAILGFAEVAKLTFGSDARLWLRPLRLFDPPVRVHELKRQGGAYAPLQEMAVWKPGNVSSLYPLDASEASYMRQLCGL